MHPLSKLHTNPAQLLLQMGQILRARHPNISLTPHATPTNQSSVEEHKHYANLPSKTATLTVQADHDNDAANAVRDLSAVTHLWYLRNSITGQPYLGGLTDTQDSATLASYTKRRDQYRQAAGAPDRWSDNTLPFAGRSWRRVSPLTPQLNCRILFDKHVHGGNVKKWKLKAPFSEECPICQQPDSQTHWLRDCTGFHQVALRHTLQDKLQALYR